MWGGGRGDLGRRSGVGLCELLLGEVWGWGSSGAVSALVGGGAAVVGVMVVGACIFIVGIIVLVIVVLVTLRRSGLVAGIVF